MINIIKKTERRLSLQLLWDHLSCGPEQESGGKGQTLTKRIYETTFGLDTSFVCWNLSGEGRAWTE